MKKNQKYMFVLLTVFSLRFLFAQVQETSAAQAEESLKTDPGPESEKNTQDFVIEDNVLVEYRGEEATVVIPDNVTVIGSRVFFRNTSLVHLVLPEGLERIEDSAFLGCELLEDVQMPESLYYIGDSVFFSCRKLSEIDLSSVKEIGVNAFVGTGLTQVDLSALEKAGGTIFEDTDIDFSNLEHVPEEMHGNLFYGSRYWREYGSGEAENTFWIVDGVLLSGMNCSGEVKIPETVNKIAPKAFMGNRNITSVAIPDSVTYIGEAAFNYCKKLKTVRMEDSVTEMEESVFLDCTRLTDIRLSNQLQTIPVGCFERCFALKKLSLPENLTVVDDATFPDSPQKQITIPPGSQVLNMWNILKGDVLYVTDLSQVSESPALKKAALTNEIKELALTVSKLTLKVGEKYALRFNSGAKATWKSSKTSVATVGKTGNIYAKKAGTTVITATLYKKEYTCTVTVVKK